MIASSNIQHVCKVHLTAFKKIATLMQLKIPKMRLNVENVIMIDRINFLECIPGTAGIQR